MFFGYQTSHQYLDAGRVFLYKGTCERGVQTTGLALRWNCPAAGEEATSTSGQVPGERSGELAPSPDVEGNDMYWYLLCTRYCPSCLISITQALGNPPIYITRDVYIIPLFTVGKLRLNVPWVMQLVSNPTLLTSQHDVWLTFKRVGRHQL